MKGINSQMEKTYAKVSYALHHDLIMIDFYRNGTDEMVTLKQLTTEAAERLVLELQGAIEARRAHGGVMVPFLGTRNEGVAAYARGER